MKKLISTQGLPFGEYYDENIATALKERVNPRLEHLYSLYSGEEIHTHVTFHFDVAGGEVQSIVLDYTIDNPTRERLSNFRDICDMFFNLTGFIVNYDEPHCYYIAIDNFDKGCLIHALEVMSVSLESVMTDVFEEQLDRGAAVYTSSGSTIIQIPNVAKYRIQEGTTWIAPNALKNCPRLRFLDIPYGMINHHEILESVPKIKYKVWDTLYDGTLPDEEDVDDDDDQDFVLDEHMVAYSRDGKRLLFVRNGFHETHYSVPDGVEEIADLAFCFSPHYVELSIPRSVRIIGDDLFTNGGHIVIRDT